MAGMVNQRKTGLTELGSGCMGCGCALVILGGGLIVLCLIPILLLMAA